MNRSQRKKMFHMQFLLAFSAVAFWGCTEDQVPDDQPNAGNDQQGGITDELKQEVATNYADIVLASYEDALEKAQELDTAIDAFVADPTEQNFDTAKQAWLDSRPTYLQTEVYRFYDGPIDNGQDGPEGLINAWPLDENNIDYVRDPADDEAPYDLIHLGIINDSDNDGDAIVDEDMVVEITADSLIGALSDDNEALVTTGYHAIEFLLWGQDFDIDNPGQRPFTDFVDGGTAFNQDRRRTYLAVASDLLLTHLESLVAAWAEDNADNYRASFVASPDAAIGKILAGMIFLVGRETGGERLAPVIRNRDREEEHSCFSDNTKVDMVEDVRGIQNVYLGQYARLDGSTVSGSGIQALVAAVDSDLAQEAATSIATSLTAASALDDVFEQEFLEGGNGQEGLDRLEALFVALQASQDVLLQQVVAAIEIEPDYGEEFEGGDPIDGLE